MSGSRNKYTIIMLLLIIIILSCVIVAIWTHLPKVKYKNERMERDIGEKIEEIVEGTDEINDMTNANANENANVNSQEINQEEITTINEESIITQDYTM